MNWQVFFGAMATISGFGTLFMGSVLMESLSFNGRARKAHVFATVFLAVATAVLLGLAVPS